MNDSGETFWSDTLEKGKAKARRFREVPDTYFMPKTSLKVTTAKYFTVLLAGLGVGVVVGKWMDRKVQGKCTV